MAFGITQNEQPKLLKDQACSTAPCSRLLQCITQNYSLFYLETFQKQPVGSAESKTTSAVHFKPKLAAPELKINGTIC